MNQKDFIEFLIATRYCNVPICLKPMVESLITMINGWIANASLNNSGMMDFEGFKLENKLPEYYPELYENPLHKGCIDIIYKDPRTGKRIAIQFKISGGNDYKLREHNTIEVDFKDVEKSIQIRKFTYNSQHEKDCLENNIDEFLLVLLRNTRSGVIIEYIPFDYIGKINKKTIRKNERKNKTTSYVASDNNRIRYRFTNRYTYTYIDSIKWNVLATIPNTIKNKAKVDLKENGEAYQREQFVIPIFNAVSKTGVCNEQPLTSGLNLLGDKKAGKTAREIIINENCSNEEVLIKTFEQDDMKVLFKGCLFDARYCKSRSALIFTYEGSKNKFGELFSEALGIDNNTIITNELLLSKNINAIQLSQIENESNIYTLKLICQ